MGLILAAAPYEEFVRENSVILVVIFFLILALLVVRLVVKTMTRTILLALITLMVLFVFIERDNIQECTETCSCTIATVDIEMPACDPNVI